MAQNCNVDLTACSAMTKPAVFYSILIVRQHAFISSALTQVTVIVSRLQQRSRLEISCRYPHCCLHCYQYYYLLEAMYPLWCLCTRTHASVPCSSAPAARCRFDLPCKDTNTFSRSDWMAS